MIKEGQRRKGLRIFNNSLLSNKKIVCHRKNHVPAATIFLKDENIFDDQVRCEYLKHEIRNLSIQFSVSEAKKKKKK